GGHAGKRGSRQCRARLCHCRGGIGGRSPGQGRRGAPFGRIWQGRAAGRGPAALSVLGKEAGKMRGAASRLGAAALAFLLALPVPSAQATEPISHFGFTTFEFAERFIQRLAELAPEAEVELHLGNCTRMACWYELTKWLAIRSYAVDEEGNAGNLSAVCFDKYSPVDLADLHANLCFVLANIVDRSLDTDEAYWQILDLARAGKREETTRFDGFAFITERFPDQRICTIIIPELAWGDQEN